MNLVASIHAINVCVCVLNSLYTTYLSYKFFIVFMFYIGVIFSSPLTLLLQCLPKEPMDYEDASFEVTIKAKKRKRTETASIDSLPSIANTSIKLVKLTINKLEMISQAIPKASCKETILLVQFVLKNITSLNFHAQV